ncbi:MAG: HDOD domain-containing protein [Desulfarculus sp.]|nr:HDOD domain-containing protein [Desulfarculus sp.]
MLKGLQHKIRNLPTLPAILSQIIDLLEQPNSSATDIERVLKNDQALTSKLLAMANSAYYAFQFEVTTVRRAVVAVGYSEVRNLCMGLSLMGFLKPSVFRDRQMAELLWLHSLAVAQGAKLLTQKTRGMDPEVAYTAGLLHDIGKVVLAAFYPDEVEKLRQLLAQGGLAFSEAEHQLGVSHSEVGKFLSEHWKLPELLSQVISRHHTPHASLEHHQMVSAVHAADYLAHGLGFGDGYRPEPPKLNPKALEGLGMEVAQFKECAMAVAQGREQIHDLWRQMVQGTGG